MDSAVAISAMATNPGDLWDYVCGGTGKGQPLLQKGLPIVTITTTAGTGSEINCWGVISNPETHEKIGFGSPELCPVLAIVDPELMRTVPAQYTAYQGFDALFHNTEVMISNGINILSETIALSAIEHISQYLPRAVKNNNDMEAREHIAYGSTMAGITMQLTSTTAEHSMELLKLQEDCGVADLKMSDYGFTPDEAMILAKGARAMQGGLFLANPCEMSDEDCAAIFKKSYR